MSAPPPVDISGYLKPLPVPQVPVLDESVWEKSEDLTHAFRELQTSKAIDLGVQVIPKTGISSKIRVRPLLYSSVSR